MDRLLKCAQAFEALLDTQYGITIGRKGRTASLRIGFSKLNFHHLMGLGKLADLSIFRKDRAAVFDDILAGRITYGTLLKSRHFALIERRFEPLAQLGRILDGKWDIFRYNEAKNPSSRIKADYLISASFEDNPLYTFIIRGDGESAYSFCSFFPKEGQDYTRGQAAYSILRKERRDLRTNSCVVLYERPLGQR